MRRSGHSRRGVKVGVRKVWYLSTVAGWNIGASVRIQAGGHNPDEDILFVEVDGGFNGGGGRLFLGRFVTSGWKDSQAG